MSLEVLRALAAGGEGLVLATILEVRGSTPRHAGSKLAAGPEGLRAGSVGGGRGEALVLEAGQGQLPVVLELDMHGADAEGPDMVCGGTSRILVERIADPAPYRAALERLEAGERAVLVKREDGGPTGLLDGQGAWIGVALPGVDAGAARRAAASGHTQVQDGWVYDPLLPPEKLLVLGGGHVGRALAQLAPGLGFAVTVAEDRPAFLDPARFPGSVATLAGPFPEVVAAYPFDPATYVVVVTRGHLSDLACVRALLGRPWHYAGLMGSRRKVAMLLDRLRQEGADPAALAALRAPIGLPLGAETPEELAVAIAGELVAARRGASLFASVHAARGERCAAP